MEIFSKSPKNLKRKHYSSVDKLAKEIASYLNNDEGLDRAVTLATDFRWWAKGVIQPHMGCVTNKSIGYEGDFLDYDLINALLNAGLSVMPFSNQGFYYLVKAKY